MTVGAYTKEHIEQVVSMVLAAMLMVGLLLLPAQSASGQASTNTAAMEQAYRTSLLQAKNEPRLQITPKATTPENERATVTNTTDGITHCGITSGHTAVWLTFDDSGTTSQISSILSILRHYNVRAVFFPTGEFAAARPDLITLIKNDGHFVGNHSYSHPDLMTLSTTQIRSEITRAEAAIKPYPSTRKFFRAPYGSGAYSSTLISILNGYAYQDCFWTVDTLDWTGASASSMLSTVKTYTRARGIVLFHMHGKYTAAALPSVIQYIQSTGYGMPKLR